MATIGEDLRTALLDAANIVHGSTYVDGRCHQQRVPRSAEAKYPRIWYRRNRRQREKYLDGTLSDLTETSFDVEAISDKLDQALDLADAIADKLPLAAGTLGSTDGSPVQGVFVDDQDDDYIAQGIAADTGQFIAALTVRVFHST